MKKDDEHTEQPLKICPKCNGKKKFDLCYTSEPCSLCDQTGLYGKPLTLAENFQRIVHTYERSELTTTRTPNPSQYFKISETFTLYTRITNVPVHKINAPPFEFQSSEYCLRKIANDYLPYNTPVSLFYFKKASNLNKYCSRTFLLKIHTDEFIDATKFYEYLRTNLFYGELELLIFKPKEME